MTGRTKTNKSPEETRRIVTPHTKSRIEQILSAFPPGKFYFELYELPMSRTKAYGLFRNNNLKATHIGRRVVVLAVDLAEFLAGLPERTPGLSESHSERARKVWEKRRGAVAETGTATAEAVEQ